LSFDVGAISQLRDCERRARVSEWREISSRKRERGSQGSKRERLENGPGNEVIEQALE
jgi:hypothetical protein